MPKPILNGYPDKLAKHFERPLDIPDITVNLSVNGNAVTARTDPELSLLDYLRDDLGLTGAKKGCDVGACGTCTVIVDGKAVRCCEMKMEKCDGVSVETIENLAQDGKLHALQKSFIEMGGTQCGYSTPGMIMAAKALLDKNPKPTQEQVSKALIGNLCRCTGYQQIIESVMKASGQSVDTGPWMKIVPQRKDDGLSVVGKSVENVRALKNVTGETKYTADRTLEGMLHVQTVRAPAPHGLINSIDTKEAEAFPGVVKVITAKDIPGENLFGKMRRDQPVLCDEKFRYIGDALALVVAETRDIAMRAAQKVKVDFTPLPIFTNPVDAFEADRDESIEKVHKKGNKLYHCKIRKGDVEKGFSEADTVIERWYQTPHQDHAPMECECSIAYWDKDDGKLVVMAPTQHVYFDRLNIFRALGLPKDDVRSIQTPVGGAFGKREDVYGQIHVALATLMTGRPTKCEYTREEGMCVTQKRHPMFIRIKSGVKKDGSITALEAEIYGDSGAYASWSENVLRKACVHVSGTYEIENCKIDSYAIYTNNPFTGAMRGFGTANSQFCTESHWDLVAHELGMDPLEFRRKNAFKKNSKTATGQTLHQGDAVRKCMDAASKEFAWNPKDFKRDTDKPHLKRGIGMANCWYGIGFGCGIPDRGDAIVELSPPANPGDAPRATIWVSTTDYGQGSDTIFRQICAEALGLNFEDIDLFTGDTKTTPNCGSTVASRQTFITGNAILNTSKVLARDMREIAAKLLKCASPDKVNLAKRKAEAEGKSVSLSDVVLAFADYGKPYRRETIFKGDRYTEPLDPETGQGNAYFPYAMGTNMCEVEVNTLTGRVKVIRMTAAHHVGRALNPLAVRGQIVGGISMGIGFGLSEDLKMEDGIPHNQNFNTYQLMRFRDLPDITSIVVEDADPTGPYGAIGIGEPPTIPVAPAILNAIYDAVGIRLFRPPATPKQVKAALDGKIEPDGTDWLRV